MTEKVELLLKEIDDLKLELALHRQLQMVSLHFLLIRLVVEGDNPKIRAQAIAHTLRLQLLAKFSESDGDDEEYDRQTRERLIRKTNEFFDDLEVSILE